MALDFDKEIEGFIKNKDKIEAERERLHKIREEENIIIKEEILRKCNINIESVYDFVNTSDPYPEAVEPLLEILEKRLVDEDVILAGIVRALTIKDAKGKVEERLLKQYCTLTQKQKSKSLGWVFGNAIEYLYSDDYFDDVVEIVKDRENGMSRQMFVLALGKTKKHKEQAEDLLIDLTYDKDVRLHAIEALKKLKANTSKVKKRMVELSKNSNKTINKKANQFLKKLL